MKLNLKSVDLNLLTVFEAIMESRQLTRAGDELGMSQPAVSAALQRLRLTFRDDLFIRTRQGMEPTPRARAIYPQLRNALETIRGELQDSRRFLPARCTRHFRILGGDYVENLFYASLLERFESHAPGISTEVQPLRLEDIGPRLKRGEIDMAVHYAAPDDSQLQCETILDDRLVVIFRQDHPRIGDELGERQFLEEQHVALLPDDRGASHLARFMNRPGVGRKVMGRVGQFSSMVPVVLATDYVGVMPCRLAEWFSERYPVRYLDMPLDAPKLPINLLWARRFRDDLAHAWVRDQLRDVMMASAPLR